MYKSAITELLSRRSKLTELYTGTFVWGDNTYNQLGVTPYRVTNITKMVSDKTWTNITCGFKFVIATDANNNLYSWGNNNYGQLGIGNRITQSTPQPIDNTKSWKQAVCGGSHVAAIDSSDRLYSWGSSSRGQLGYELTGGAVIPYEVDNTKTWKCVSCGNDHTLAIDNSGFLWSWGYNSYGQLGLGDGTLTQYALPQLVGSSNNWALVKCGYNHSLALDNNGKVWAWGYNVNGQLGLGHNTNVNIPTKLPSNKNWLIVDGGGLHTVGIDTDGYLWAWGDNQYGQLGLDNTTSENIPILTDDNKIWSKISCGYYHTLVKDTSNSIYVCGRNHLGQLGTQNTTDLNTLHLGWLSLTNWTNICCNKYAYDDVHPNTTHVINTAGEIWLAGTGSTIHIDTSVTNIPIKKTDIASLSNIFCGGRFSYGVTTSGNVIRWGDNTYAQLLPITIISSPSAVYSINIAGGSNSTAAIINGELYTWGHNYSGQLGIGTSGTSYNVTTPQLVTNSIGTAWKQVSCGGSHTAAIDTGNNLYTWGYNYYGQLGIGTSGTSSNVTTPQLVIHPIVGRTWAYVACGVNNMYAIDNMGYLYSWGGSDLGYTISNYQTTPRLVTNSIRWNSISVGQKIIVALDISNKIYVWGRYATGQQHAYTSYIWSVTPLMIGDKTWKQVSCGEYHILAIDDQDALYSFGFGRYGELGLTSVISSKTPLRVHGDSIWKHVSCGYNHSIAVDADDNIYTWGYNYYGQLGIGTSGSYSNVTSPASATFQRLKFLNMACGYAYVIFINDNNKLVAAGANNYGQLGIGNTNPKSSSIELNTDTLEWKSVSCGTNHTAAITTGNQLWAWGYNYYGQLGLGNNTQYTIPQRVGTGTAWKQVSCGYAHTGAVDVLNRLYMFGYNNCGQLGQNNITNSNIPLQVTGAWSYVSCGEHCTMAIKTDGTLWAWGCNANYQLGLGNNPDNVLVPTQVGSNNIWVRVICRTNISVAVTTLGDIYVCGNNEYGQLGLGNVSSQYEFVKIPDITCRDIDVGESHVVALRKWSSLLQ